MNKEKIVDLFNSQSPKTPMCPDETSFMINVIMLDSVNNFDIPLNELSKDSEEYQHFKPIIESFFAQIFIKRLEYLTSLKISLGALIILSYHMDNPARAVMYLYYLHLKYKTNATITCSNLCEVFPNGFFSDKQLDIIWDGQKAIESERKGYTCIGAPDNMLDYVEVWK